MSESATHEHAEHTEHQAAAAAVTPPVDRAVRPADLTGDIEAMLITSGRAVAVARLAVALGLAVNEDVVAADLPPVEELAEAAEGAEGEAAAPAPVKKPRKKRKKAGGPDPAELIGEAVVLLNAAYEKTGRAFRIESVAGGYRFMTLPAHARAVGLLHGLAAQQKLSKAAVETLAIIAYKQPVTKSTLEAIRGVSCGEVLRSLLERRLITIAGRAEELGRPILYATSKVFLEAFGLGSLKDLPSPLEVTGKAVATGPMPGVVVMPTKREKVAAVPAAVVAEEGADGPAGAPADGADGDGGQAEASATAEAAN